mmetsp:Transcript_29782/g.91969  ORF Transcript_29782/g.91969 Transcript_29782/m.91969 type:complete len:146 (-) Transcript_29782:25-462(-)
MKVLALMAALQHADAMAPRTSRRVALERCVGAAAAVAIAPAAAIARSSYEMELKSTPGSGDDDMKGLLSSFTNDLDDKAKAKAQKAADEARPIQEKIKAELDKQQAAAAAPKAAPGTVTSRPKAAKKKACLVDCMDDDLASRYGL